MIKINKYLFCIFSLAIVFLFVGCLKSNFYNLDKEEVSASGNWTDDCSEGFNLGRGTENEPYLINSPQELAYMFKEYTGDSSLSRGKYFKLSADIDLSSHFWNFHTTSNKDFAGTFDGGGFYIKNLQVPASCIGGLFCWNVGGVIKNIKFLSPKIESIHACTTAYYNYSGGIIENIVVYNGIIKSSNNFAAGICVDNNTGNIKNCFVEADISATFNDVIDENPVFGIAYKGTITNCLFNGKVSYANKGTQTLYGYPITSGKSSNCYYNNSFSNGTGNSKTENELKNWNNVSGLGEAWSIDPKINDGLPYLKYFYWQEQN